MMQPPMDPMAMGAPPVPAAPMPTGPDPMAMGAAPMGPAPAPPAPPMPMPEPPMPEPEPLDDLAPVYSSWLYKRDPKTGLKTLSPPKEPSAAYCQSAVASDERRHGHLIERFRHDLRTYALMDESMFEDLNPGDIELYTSAEPAFQIDKLANMIHAIPHVIQFPYKNPEEMEDAQTLENFAYHFLETADQHHRLAGNATLKWDMTFSRGVYGRIVTRILPDDSDPDFPWDVRLYDPATVFPVFGTKRGISRVTCVYTETLDKIVQSYGDNSAVLKELMGKHTDEDGKIQLDRVGTVREYWDVWWKWVEWDGIEVLPVTAHELGRVPFDYTIGTGQMGSANMPLGGKGDNTLREKISDMVLGGPQGDADLAKKGMSFFHHIQPALKQEAAILSILMTSAKQSLNPPTAVESPYEGPPEPIDMQTGATNKVRPGEKIVPLLSGAKPTDVGPLITSLREQRVKGGLPDQLFGTMEGSQVSGFAVESLIAAAKDRIQPVITDVEYHIASMLETALYMYRNVGHYFVDDPEGGYHLPLRGRKNSAPQSGKGPSKPQFQQLMQTLMGMGMGMPVDFAAGYETQHLDNRDVPNPQPTDMIMTRGHIMRIGTRPEVKLHSLQLQNMTAMANVASMLIDKKIWSRFHAMEELDVKNPQDMWKQILSEDAQTNPRMLELVAFPQALYESGNMSGFLAYMATVLIPQMMQGMMGQAAPVDGGGGGAMTNIPQGGGAQTVQGSSQPMNGQGAVQPAM